MQAIHKRFQSGKVFKIFPFGARSNIRGLECHLFHLQQLRDRHFWYAPRLHTKEATDNYIAHMAAEGRAAHPREKLDEIHQAIHRRAKELHPRLFHKACLVSGYNRALMKEPDFDDVITSTREEYRGCLKWYEQLPFGITLYDVVHRGLLQELTALYTFWPHIAGSLRLVKRETPYISEHGIDMSSVEIKY